MTADPISAAASVPGRGIPTRPPFDWTETAVETLRDAWARGLSASRIAERLGGGATRNAVIGKAHRLKLAPRPNPIVRRPKQPVKRARRRRTSGLAEAPFSTPADVVARRRAAAEARAMPAGPRACYDPSNPGHDPRDCRFPIGDMSTPTWHYCQEPQAPRSPYCPTHHAVVYRRDGQADGDAA
ncbi:MAG: GcrA family cell cycle regulator [Alphaproteobacteria bacterium]